MKKEVLLVLLLSGCGSETIVTRPVEVEVPVIVPCAVAVEKPVYPLAQLAQNAGFFEKARALIAENELRRAYAERLEAANSGCVAGR